LEAHTVRVLENIFYHEATKPNLKTEMEWLTKYWSTVSDFCHQHIGLV